MTQLDNATPPSRSSHPIRTIIAWALILTCVVYMMVNAARELRVEAKESLDPTKPTAADAQFRIVARMAIGTDEFYRRTNNPATQQVTSQLKQIDDTAKTDRQKIEAAIVAGEIGGKAEALWRLSAIHSHDATLREDIAILRSIYTRGVSGRISATTAASNIAVSTTEPDETSNELTPEPELAPPATQPATTSVALTPRQQLVHNFGWFGRLANTFGTDASNKDRVQLRDDSFKSFLSLIFFLGLVGVMLVAGLVLLIVAIILIALGTIRTRYIPQPRPGMPPVFLEAFAIYLSLFNLINLAVPHLAGADPSRSRMMTLAAVGIVMSLLLLPLGLLWPVFNGLTFRESRIGFGWYDGWHVLREAAMGVVGYLTGIPVIAMGFFISLMLARFSSVPATHPIIDEIAHGGAGLLIALFLLACVWAPVMEETFFRGALFNHLRRRWMWIGAAPLVGLIFAAIHPQGWTFIPTLGAIGVVLAGIREWRGSLIASMVAHGLNNCIVLTFAYMLLHGG